MGPNRFGGALSSGIGASVVSPVPEITVERVPKVLPDANLRAVAARWIRVHRLGPEGCLEWPWWSVAASGRFASVPARRMRGRELEPDH